MIYFRIRDDYTINPVSPTNELLCIRDDYMLNPVSLTNELLCIRDDYKLNPCHLQMTYFVSGMTIR